VIFDKQKCHFASQFLTKVEVTQSEETAMTMTLDPHTPTKTHPGSADRPLDVVEWVNELTTLMSPDQIVWCDGSKEEATGLIDLMVTQGTLEAL
jgi:phosphoenolpyruvate carboxykinase (GTP)